MKPSEVRQRILEDHEVIRAILVSLEYLAGQVIAGSQSLGGPLRLEGEGLLVRLHTHMGWEDTYLRPALLEAKKWGEMRAHQLDADHREQRELLTLALDRLQDPSRPPILVARGVLDLVKLIRADMDEEEQAMLGERILRVDVESD